MGSAKKLRLAVVYPPSDFIAEELEARGWTIEDLAFFSGRSVRVLEGVIKENKPLTRETAAGLGKAFGTSSELWRNLESAYRSRIGQQSKRRPVAVIPRAPSVARQSKRALRKGRAAKGAKSGK